MDSGHSAADQVRENLIKPGNAHLRSERKQNLLIRAALGVCVCVCVCGLALEGCVCVCVWFIPATKSGWPQGSLHLNFSI